MTSLSETMNMLRNLGASDTGLEQPKENGESGVFVPL